MGDQILTPVHQHNISANCFAVSLAVPTSINSNVRIGIGIFPNNIAKNVFIYRAVINNSDTAEADITITQYSSIDSYFTSVLTPMNLQLGSPNTSLCTVQGSSSGDSGPINTSGTRLAVYRMTSNHLGFECFQNGSGIYIPANTSGQVANFYVKVPTAGKYGLLTIEYIEY